MTRRLYHDDAALRRFDAEVVALTTYKARPAIVLAETAFYPEAGGQLSDVGTIDLGGKTFIVDDVTLDDDGTILRLRHTGLTQEAVTGHAAGWDQFLPGLVEVATAD